ncbi:hypothetical protein HBI23_131270 [Parastagonospora nodorum]|nr:hypothetical protein HBH74_187160 [Parastagonospora nodorum]KAH4947455.1 hypothetical protein HBH73_135120 [Parastagonospora nodorum]KAH5090289.1 hypothetical protein HBH72_218270 [Parastagonospora nodorum]KAH5202880.1 hypothetical protein HBH77_115590 [Parastagonospora nodorum]KAH5660326.1 hypothetical protein HBI23_131270 [Parastagonospora nodorum]
MPLVRAMSRYHHDDDRSSRRKPKRPLIDDESDKDEKKRITYKDEFKRSYNLTKHDSFHPYLWKIDYGRARMPQVLLARRAESSLAWCTNNSRHVMCARFKSWKS